MIKPLTGFRIGVTADRRSDEQIQMLEGRGAKCVHGAMLRTHPLGPEAEIAEATARLVESPPDFTVLTTGIGVRGWFAAADSLLMGESLLAALEQSMIITRGPKACGAAVTAGLVVDWNAPAATSDEVLEFLAERGVEGCTVAVQLDGDPSRGLPERIRKLGATVQEIPVYQWTRPADRPAAETLIRSISDGQIDAVTFTARPAVVNFASISKELGRFDEVVAAFLSGTQVVSVGPVTAAAIEEVGLGTSTSPERSRLGAMVMHLTDELTGCGTTIALAGRSVLMRGRLIVVDDESPELLTGREQQLLQTLAERPGVVFSKAALLEKIWGSSSSDAHVVEVTVGRLRRRLGDAGVGIETVVRRGYRVSPV